MAEILEKINRLVWGVPALILILSVGIYLTARTGFVQITLFPKAWRMFKSLFHREKGSDQPSAYQALCTALAATVGTGNLVGVAGAIAIGGPGALFWMWISAFLGMATKYAEAALAVRYRKKNKSGEYVGGPMYMIENGLSRRWHWLGTLYCFFGVVAAFGVGNATQINAIIGSTAYAIHTFQLPTVPHLNLLIGILVSVIVLAVFMGGAKRIGHVAEHLVPFAAGAYLLFSVLFLLIKRENIPDAFRMIFYGAFSPKAVTGGMLGSAFAALRVGIARGVFTNEAGMGTASIAHAGADVSHPAQQGLMGIMEVFIDTIVICTLTGLVILSSGVSISYGEDTGILLAAEAFGSVYGRWFSLFLAICLCCFAFATVLGWGLYGARCAQYLFGDKVWRLFAVLQAGAVILGAVLKTGTVWMLSETINGLMAIPNLIALMLLSPELIKLTTEYRKSSLSKEDHHVNKAKK